MLFIQTGSAQSKSTRPKTTTLYVYNMSLFLVVCLLIRCQRVISVNCSSSSSRVPQSDHLLMKQSEHLLMVGMWSNETSTVANCWLSVAVPVWVSSQKVLLKCSTSGRRILSTTSLTLFEVLPSMSVLTAVHVLNQSSTGKGHKEVEGAEGHRKGEQEEDEGHKVARYHGRVPKNCLLSDLGKGGNRVRRRARVPRGKLRRHNKCYSSMTSPFMYLWESFLLRTGSELGRLAGRSCWEGPGRESKR